MIGKLGRLAAVCVGCSTADLAPVPDLTRATDMNPDPNIVEVILVASNATTDYGDGTRTDVLAYRDGDSEATVPGPMIEAKLGDRLIVHLHNELVDRETTLHWHGLRLPIEMDGDPSAVAAVPPGGSYDYDFVLQDAGLFWYHPHVDTDEQIELGLQGPLLVHAPADPAIAIERALVLDDVDLDDDRQVRIEPSHVDLVLGRRGDALLVNGKSPGVVVASAGSVERWRIVNTSNGRFFDLDLDGLPLRVIGWDGGLIPQPYDVDHLVVAPGERYDVVVSFDRARGSAIDLETLAVPRGHGGTDPAARILRIELDGEPLSAEALPTAGPAIPPIPITSQTAVRPFVLTEVLEGPQGAIFLINGQRWPLNTPLDVILGDVEVLEVQNDADGDHPMHIHGHFVQLEGQLGWKDTFVVPAHTKVRAAVRYEAPGKWMFHCQIPEHAERGMTADLNVRPR
ncbi:MAG: multicopper oxidase family protein [Kofleriaceae bacterium]